MARLFISTGEASGDLQGALLITALKRQAIAAGVELEILALGGLRMAQAGAKLLSNTSTIGSIGLLEALPYIWPTLRLQQRAKQYLRQHPPQLVVLIDYMGGNLPMGKFAQQLQVPVVYYIAPHEWVWSEAVQPGLQLPWLGRGSGRSHATTQIINFTDQLLAIFPQEAKYYQAQGQALGARLSVTWVGHPLVDSLQSAPGRQQARAQLGISPDQWAVALLPASRQQEIKYLLPVIFQAAQQIQAQLPQVHFWIPLALENYRQAITEAIQHYKLRATLVNDSQGVLAAADLAIAKSGTVNLEIALLDVPQVVVYRVSRLTAWVVHRLLRLSIPFMSPPNLVERRLIVPELWQEQATADQIAQAALELLLNPVRRQQVLDGYQQMRSTLGGAGAVDRAAQKILQLLGESSPD